jgi:hypothetical protein
MACENQTDSPVWSFSVPFGWSVEWDPSRLAMTLRNDAMFWAEHGVNFHDVCSRVLISSAVTLNKLA